MVAVVTLIQYFHINCNHLRIHASFIYASIVFMPLLVIYCNYSLTFRNAYFINAYKQQSELINTSSYNLSDFYPTRFHPF